MVYQSENERLKTFKNWPIEFITPDQLAKSGFIFSGEEDMVTCPFCTFECSEWEEGDNPFNEHRDGSPGCSYVNLANIGSDGIICNLR